MNIDLVNEIIACLPGDRTCFPYYRDRYAPMLLPWLVEDGSPLAGVKKSRYASLLEKAPAKAALKYCGDGRFNAKHFRAAWAEPHEQFLLTLGTWGGGCRAHAQTSRTGYNLVLQVNLHDGYRKLFDRLVAEDLQFWFDSYGHPVLKRRKNGFYRQTLGWIRLDIDFDGNESVIEEIQTDWIRDAHSAVRANSLDCDAPSPDYRKLTEYSRTVIIRLGAIWDEILMSAALWFLREELGIRTVWYHTYASGNRLKRIKWSYPPRSLYTRLPRKFCFEHSAEHPTFLMDERAYRRELRNHEDIRWFKMTMI